MGIQIVVCTESRASQTAEVGSRGGGAGVHPLLWQGGIGTPFRIFVRVADEHLSMVIFPSVRVCLSVLQHISVKNQRTEAVNGSVETNRL